MEFIDHQPLQPESCQICASIENVVNYFMMNFLLFQLFCNLARVFTKLGCHEMDSCEESHFGDCLVDSWEDPILNERIFKDKLQQPSPNVHIHGSHVHLNDLLPCRLVLDEYISAVSVILIASQSQQIMRNWLLFCIFILVASNLGQPHPNGDATVKLLRSPVSHLEIVDSRFEQLPYLLCIFPSVVVRSHVDLRNDDIVEYRFGG